MEAVFVVLGVVALLIWFLRGVINDRVREAREEVDAFEEIYQKNHEADNSGPDSELDKRVRDRFKSR